MLAGSMTSAAQENAAANRLEQFLEGLETLSAAFEQTLYNEYGAELEVATGTMYLKQPGRFHWVYNTPYQQFLISDGASLWIYDADLEQVTINNVTGAIESSPASVLTGDVDIDARYTVTDLGRGKDVDFLELAAKGEDSQYNAITIGFRGDELAEMVLADNLGQTTRIVFSEVRRNPPLDPELFEFKPPAGVDIIDNRQ
jgi:outer membrane lipoprotein carrier protein